MCFLYYNPILHFCHVLATLKIILLKSRLISSKCLCLAWTVSIEPIRIAVKKTQSTTHATRQFPPALHRRTSPTPFGRHLSLSRRGNALSHVPKDPNANPNPKKEIRPKKPSSDLPKHDSNEAKRLPLIRGAVNKVD